MGVNNKQRRAARKRKERARQGSGSAGPGAGGWAAGAGPGHADAWYGQEPTISPDAVRDLLLDVFDEVGRDRSAAGRCAALLLAAGRPLTPEIAQRAVRSLLTELVVAATTLGWAPSDLAEVTRRLGCPELVPLVAALLHEQCRRHAPDRVAAAWLDDLAGVGAAEPLRVSTPEGLRMALELGSVLAGLPALPPVLPSPGQPAGQGAHPRDRKLLGRVQALLAKAEATEFADEAEALTAKAQELISRHALERLLETAPVDGGQTRLETRRLWLDPPYALAKSMLVHVVADANRCRSVMSESLGCCTLVGPPADLDAVEVLVPSLLVQAHAGLQRHGRQTDRTGTSRTRSFRASFLLSYAHRIGERLNAADAAAAAATGRSGELVPIVRRTREAVDAACQQLFPAMVSRAASASNAAGWVAGRAAADEALFGAEMLEATG